MQVAVGETIKRIRMSKNLSLRELASKAGLSATSLSNIEKNMNSPTLESLAKICDALQVHMIDLLEETQDSSALITRKEDRRSLAIEGASKIAYEMVSPQTKDFKLMYITLAPKCDYGYEAKDFPHDEICIVVSGSMDIEVEGESYSLSTGDSIYINANTRYKYRNMTDEDCVTLWSVQGISK